MLGDVRQGLGDDEVRGGLDERRQSILQVALDGDRDRTPVRQALEGRPQARLGEDRRMDAACELPQLADGLLQFAFGVRDGGDRFGRFLGGLGMCEAQRE